MQRWLYLIRLIHFTIVNCIQIDASDPENLLKVSKKGKTIMTFVQVSGQPTRNEAEDLTKLWQSALWNNHIQAERCIKAIMKWYFI